MASKKHVTAAAAYTFFFLFFSYAFLELQNMYSTRLVCYADSSSTFQTKLCDMILYDKLIFKNVKMQIDVAVMQNWQSLTTTSISFANILDSTLQHNILNSRHFYQKRTNFRTGSGSCFDLKHGSFMFRLFRKPVSVLDEKSNKTFCDSESCSRFT